MTVSRSREHIAVLEPDPDNRAVSIDILHFRARVLVAPGDVRVALEELMRCQQSTDHRQDAVPVPPAATL